jgi:nucleotide-binding universal stress UspA family protein
MARVICGFDGSEPARGALRLALEEGKLRGCDVRVVTVVPRFERGAAPFGFEVKDPSLDREQLTKAQETATEAVASARKEVSVGDETSVTVVGKLGVPAEEIMSESRKGDLIVVGSRGLGGFKRLLLGSVSSALVHHAPCPVLVVRG